MSNMLLYDTPIVEDPYIMLPPNNPKVYAEHDCHSLQPTLTNAVGYNVTANTPSSSGTNSAQQQPLSLCSRSSADPTSPRTDEFNSANGATSFLVCTSTSIDSKTSEVEHDSYFNRSIYLPLLKNTAECNKHLILPASSDCNRNSTPEHSICLNSSTQATSLRTDKFNHVIGNADFQVCALTSNDLKTKPTTKSSPLSEPAIDIFCQRSPESNPTFGTADTLSENTIIKSTDNTCVLQSQVPAFSTSQSSQTKVDNSETVILIPLHVFNAIKQENIYVKKEDLLFKSAPEILGLSTDSDQKNISILHSRMDPSEPKTGVLKITNQKPTMAELLRPLYKYIKGNKCLLCGFESKSNATHRVRNHLATHLRDKIFKCDGCGKTFASSRNLAIHKLVHTSEYIFACDECDEKCVTKAALYRHKQKHKCAKTYCCTVCSSQFRTASSLKNHLRIHTGEKPYMCSVCKETFRTRGMLKNHVLHHNPEKLHCCSVCNKRYNSRVLLLDHMHAHKSPAYKCEICGKMFNFRSNLAQHMWVHSNARRHTCDTCGMKFKFSHHLKSHLVTHNK